MPESLFLQAAPATLLKNRLWHRCFPVNFSNFLRTPSFTEDRWTTASHESFKSLFFQLNRDVSKVNNNDILTNN